MGAIVAKGSCIPCGPGRVSPSLSNTACPDGLSPRRSISDTVRRDEIMVKLKKKTPRLDPNLAGDHCYWQTPLVNGSSATDFQPVLHIINGRRAERANKDLYLRIKDNLFIPLLRSCLFGPNWLQHIPENQSIRLILRPTEAINTTAHELIEGKKLIDKVRYLTIRINPDKSDTAKCSVELFENHGNKLRSKNRRFRQLCVNSIFVEHDSWATVFEGPEFFLTIATPYFRDVQKYEDDPGSCIDVGLYSRELDTAPSVKVRWYVTIRSMDLPRQAFHPHI